MEMHLSQEEVVAVGFMPRFIARLAIVLSWPLNFCSPGLIESLFNRLGRNYKFATVSQAQKARNSVCFVNKKCRNQNGCLKRSLAVFVYLLLVRKKCSWCTGFLMDPFRAHAWIEIGNIPIGEYDDAELYTRMIKTEDTDEIIDGYITEKHETNSFESIDNARIRDLLKTLISRKKEFTLIFLFGIFSSVINLTQPELLSRMVQHGIRGITNPNFILFLLAIVFSTFFSTLQYYYLQKVGELTVSQTRKKLTSHLMNLHISEYDQRNIGDFISRVGDDAGKLRIGIIQLIVSMTSSLFLSIGSILLLFFKDIMLSFLTLIIITTVFFIVLMMSNTIQKASFEVQKHSSKLLSLLTRDLLGIRTIRATNETESEINQNNLTIDKITELGIKLSKVQALLTPISNLGLQISIMAVVGIGMYRVSIGLMSISDLTGFLLLLYMAIGPLGQIFTSFSGVSEALGALNRIEEILNLPTESQHDIILKNNKQNLSEATIIFENVSFSYKHNFSLANDELVDYVLKSVSFKIFKGEHVAIVGPSGAGKSTILQILERFYDIDKGNVFLNGYNIKNINRLEMRNQFSYVEQNAPLLAGTLLDNLKFGNSAVTNEECLRILKTVGLGYLVEKSSLGLELIIGENGVGVSGGEKQRIALARAILSDKPILLLDELTSNLDSISERQMKEVIKEIKHKKTIISVAHRLSTIIDADRILVLEHGRLVGEGTHEQLLTSIPLYRELAKEQLLLQEADDET